MDAIDPTPMLAPSSQLRGPGSVVPIIHDGEHWLLVRGDDGVARMVINRCPHRQMPLAEEPCSMGAELRCPWHFWTFDLDGSLREAVTIDGPVAHPDRYALATREVAEHNGAIWAV
ncbi:MAG: Rieske 2Fe-2S domain-containing protein [Actinomycetia bacterium]|nr:Rieske 2Fe-2S domain-containing protein [Actinomycetes bacterium]